MTAPNPQFLKPGLPPPPPQQFPVFPGPLQLEHLRKEVAGQLSKQPIGPNVPDNRAVDRGGSDPDA